MESFRIHLLFKSASFTAILTSSLPYFNLHEHATGIKKVKISGHKFQNLSIFQGNSFTAILTAKWPISSFLSMQAV